MRRHRRVAVSHRERLGKGWWDEHSHAFRSPARMRRAGVAAAVLVILAVAAVTLPLPLLVMAPGPVIPATQALAAVDAVDEVTGELLATTVVFRQPSPAGAVQALIDDRLALVRRSELLTPGVEPAEFAEAQRHLFRESVRVAAAVGLRHAGHEVQVSGEGAEVLAVMPGAPAQGLLQPGDVVVAVGGDEVSLASELALRVAGSRPGETLAVTVQRGDDMLVLQLRTARLPETGEVGVGVVVTTVNQQISLPVDLEVVEDLPVGGPSAGLMVALAVFELYEPADLTAGRVLAGTGTVDLAGRVGPVAGVAQKAAAAEQAAADIFLVPATEAETARRATGSMRVVPVATVGEAISLLGGDPGSLGDSGPGT